MATLLDLGAFRACPRTRGPFDFLVVRDFVRAEARPAIDQAFPQVRRGGSFPVEVLSYGKAFGELVEELLVQIDDEDSPEAEQVARPSTAARADLQGGMVEIDVGLDELIADQLEERPIVRIAPFLPVELRFVRVATLVGVVEHLQMNGAIERWHLWSLRVPLKLRHICPWILFDYSIFLISALASEPLRFRDAQGAR